MNPWGPNNSIGKTVGYIKVDPNEAGIAARRIDRNPIRVPKGLNPALGNPEAKAVGEITENTRAKQQLIR